MIVRSIVGMVVVVIAVSIVVAMVNAMLMLVAVVIAALVVVAIVNAMSMLAVVAIVSVMPIVVVLVPLTPACEEWDPVRPRGQMSTGQGLARADSPTALGALAAANAGRAVRAPSPPFSA
jgi:hypothetical protein